MNSIEDSRIEKVTTDRASKKFYRKERPKTEMEKTQACRNRDQVYCRNRRVAKNQRKKVIVKMVTDYLLSLK